MDYSNYIFLLARARSGTNALRLILDGHPEIFGLKEIFHLQAGNSVGTGETNYFTFLRKQVKTDPLKLIPADNEQLFLEYLAYLRGFTGKRFILMDVKYTSTHHILKSFKAMGSPP